jgi:hypothetical protein
MDGLMGWLAMADFAASSAAMLAQLRASSTSLPLVLEVLVAGPAAAAGSESPQPGAWWPSDRLFHLATIARLLAAEQWPLHDDDAARVRWIQSMATLYRTRQALAIPPDPAAQNPAQAHSLAPGRGPGPGQGHPTLPIAAADAGVERAARRQLLHAVAMLLHLYCLDPPLGENGRATAVVAAAVDAMQSAHAVVSVLQCFSSFLAPPSDAPEATPPRAAAAGSVAKLSRTFSWEDIDALSYGASAAGAFERPRGSFDVYGALDLVRLGDRDRAFSGNLRVLPLTTHWFRGAWALTSAAVRSSQPPLAAGTPALLEALLQWVVEMFASLPEPDGLASGGNGGSGSGGGGGDGGGGGGSASLPAPAAAGTPTSPRSDSSSTLASPHVSSSSLVASGEAHFLIRAESVRYSIRRTCSEWVGLLASSHDLVEIFKALAALKHCKFFGLLVLTLDELSLCGAAPASSALHSALFESVRAGFVDAASRSQPTSEGCSPEMSLWVRTLSVLLQSPYMHRVCATDISDLGSHVLDWSVRNYQSLFASTSNLHFDPDDGWAAEALHQLLPAVAAMHCEDLSAHVFRVLLGIRTARSAAPLSAVALSERDFTFVDEEDVFGGLLSAAGVLGRQNAFESVSALLATAVEIIEDVSMVRGNEAAVEQLFERVHWMVLYSGHILFGTMEAADCGISSSPFVLDDVRRLWALQLAPCLHLLQRLLELQHALLSVFSSANLSPLLWGTVMKFWIVASHTLLGSRAIAEAAARAGEVPVIPEPLLLALDGPLLASLFTAVLGVASDVCCSWPYDKQLLRVALRLIRTLSRIDSGQWMGPEPVRLLLSSFLNNPTVMQRIPSKHVSSLLSLALSIRTVAPDVLYMEATALARVAHEQLMTLVGGGSASSSRNFDHALLCVEILCGVLSVPFAIGVADEMLLKLPAACLVLQSYSGWTASGCAYALALIKLLTAIADTHGSAIGAMGRGRRERLVEFSLHLVKLLAQHVTAPSRGAAALSGLMAMPGERRRLLKAAFILLHTLVCILQAKDKPMFHSVIEQLHALTPHLNDELLGIARVEDALMSLLQRLCTDSPDLVFRYVRELRPALILVLEFCLGRPSSVLSQRRAIEAIEALYSGNRDAIALGGLDEDQMDLAVSAARVVVHSLFRSHMHPDLLPDLCSCLVAIAQCAPRVASDAFREVFASPGMPLPPVIARPAESVLEILALASDEDAVERLLRLLATHIRVMRLGLVSH